MRGVCSLLPASREAEKKTRGGGKKRRKGDWPVTSPFFLPSRRGRGKRKRGKKKEGKGIERDALKLLFLLLARKGKKAKEGKKEKKGSL